MKKLFLLLAAGVTVASANAQESNSILLHPNRYSTHAIPATKKLHAPVIKTAAKGTQATDYNMSGWFDFYDLINTSSSANYVVPIYPDSSIVINYTDGAAPLNIHGLGVSFDPTDANYFSGGNNPLYNTTFQVTNANPYQVDSFQLAINYLDHNAGAYIDSMVVELTIAAVGDTTHGTLAHTVGAPNYFYSTTIADSAPSYTTFIYDPATGGMSDSVTQPKQRYSFLLTDDDTGVILTIPLDSVMNVPAGYKVDAFVHFVSGNQYDNGTNEDDANLLEIYSSEPGGAGTSSIQSMGSYQAALVAFTDNVYPDETTFHLSGHNVPLAGFYFGPAGQDGGTSNSSLELPDMSFHVICCGPTSVGSIANVKSIGAYPNPANDKVTVAFSLNAATATSITISNTIGQVIKTQNMGTVANGKATFSISDLAAGVYFYTVDANGQKTTNRIVVAH